MFKRALDVRLHDTRMGIWQEDARDPTFNPEIFGGLIRLLRRRGWKVGVDPDIKKNFPSLSPCHRLARKGNLIAELQIHGRSIEFTCWAETWQKVNGNGHRHDFDKRARFLFLDRLRLDLEWRCIINWLGKRATVSVSDGTVKVTPFYGGITAVEQIERDYAKSWHTDKTLGRPRCDADYNRKSADGHLLEHGATVWTTDRKGRLIRGTAYYHINNMWWVVAGRWTLLNQPSAYIYAECPEDLRRKRNGRDRRNRLEAEIARAIRADDYRRAETLRRITFGDEPIFRIWSRKNDAYYGPQYCGYTTDSTRAGRYTRAEAEREVRRVPHHLHAMAPDGARVDFAEAQHV